MKKPLAVAGLVSGACVALGLLAGPPAQAATAAASRCAVTGMTPATIVVGVTSKTVTTDVRTDCPGGHPAWELALGASQDVAGRPWQPTCNYQRPDRPACADRRTTLAIADDRPAGVKLQGGSAYLGNRMAGSHLWYATVSDDRNLSGTRDGDETEQSATGPYRLQRSTTFARSFDAPYAVPRHTRAHFTAVLKTANWDLAEWETLDQDAVLQFRPVRSRTYENVRGVGQHGGRFDFHQTVRRTGFWRIVYRGTDYLSASKTPDLYVVAG